MIRFENPKLRRSRKFSYVPKIDVYVKRNLLIKKGGKNFKIDLTLAKT